jgi:enoyl-CoA hydratase/carnithine racemase
MEEPLMSDDAPVLVSELSAANGVVGLLTLNVPETLNSLTRDMVDLLQEALDRWRDDDNIRAVFITGAGEKAFCAGGDVQALHASAVKTPGGPCDYAESFFVREYRMNYTLHSYPKPVICWGHGIVMGGGLGIMAGCAHRIATERTRIAMPEVTIALFPDVGGSWFLNHMPVGVGRFLALTAANINASDALYTGLANRFLPGGSCDALLERLLAQSWSDSPAHNHGLVRHLLRELEGPAEALPPAQLEPQLWTIRALLDGDDIHDAIDNIVALDTDDKWLAKARDGLAHGSKLAALWIDRQLSLTRQASLREAFQAEAVLATRIVRHPEFAEGVRALLIDKDRQPEWQYASSRDVPEDVLAHFFLPPWPTNPLADL